MVAQTAIMGASPNDCRDGLTELKIDFGFFIAHTWCESATKSARL
jgi:hypothetical protein